MSTFIRAGPLLQSERTITISNDNGLVTPKKVPYSDLWDINSDPVIGTTLEYHVSDMLEYAGRIMYINKIQDTTGSTIIITLPGGNIFSTSGSNTLTLPNSATNFILCFSASNIVSVIFGGPGGGPDILLKNSSARANVDPSSNQDPVTNGLIIPSGSGEFSMPISVGDQSLGIANPYTNDPDGDYTFGIDSFTVNRHGKFEISFSFGMVGSVAKTSPLIAQILEQGQSIFTAPPICSGAIQSTSDIGPFGPYTKAWFVVGTANAIIPAGTVLKLSILPNNPTDDNVLQLTGNISISRLDANGTKGDKGDPGDPGDVQAVSNVGSGATLVANPGPGPYIDIKTLLPGSNVYLNNGGSEVTINSNYPNAMLPDTLGTAYGNQDTGNVMNALGFQNSSFASRSNSLGCYLPSNLNMDESNVLSSYQNFSNGCNVNLSSMIIHGDSSNFNAVDNSVIIGRAFINAPTVHAENIEIGDFSNTTPAAYSICVNNNHYGGTIGMSKKSVYIGCGRNSISVAPQECHLDFGCPDLFYHDLTQANTFNCLYYDNTNGKITHDTLSAIHSSDLTSTVSCTSNITQVQSDDLIQINSGTGTLEITNLVNTITNNVLYYDTITRRVTQGIKPAAGTGNSSRIATVTTPVTHNALTPVNTNLLTMNIPANTFLTPGDCIHFEFNIDNNVNGNYNLVVVNGAGSSSLVPGVVTDHIVGTLTLITLANPTSTFRVIYQWGDNTHINKTSTVSFTGNTTVLTQLIARLGVAPLAGNVTGYFAYADLFKA